MVQYQAIAVASALCSPGKTNNLPGMYSGKIELELVTSDSLQYSSLEYKWGMSALPDHSRAQSTWQSVHRPEAGILVRLAEICCGRLLACIVVPTGREETVISK